MEEARDIQLNFSPGNTKETEDLAEIEQRLKYHLECMGMCCRDIGGLWNTKHNNYHKDAGPCVDTWEHCFDKPEPVIEVKRSRKWMLYVLLVGAVITGYLYRRRLKEIKRRKRAEATGEGYEDDSDDSSLGSMGDMWEFT